ncbi:DUF4153 domain-containing protein [Glycomyces sp. NRRL B-16210]|uniref:DUF4153 domain-containing protein n=1 Tax=Glycomyces sp. NRRL B-16210 TaxID=1463821 RepID=UPI00106159B9|nr:DUF4173 domain-containing protein [Glycomyces sp. NRRL B-16210]
MSDPSNADAPRSEDADGPEARGEAPDPTSAAEQAANAEAPRDGALAESSPETRPAGPPPPPPAAQGHRPLTPDEAARQAAYYRSLHQPRMIEPNPRWHRPELSASRTIVLLVVAVALFGGWAAFHADGVGIGLSLTGIALVAVPLLAAGREDLLPRLPGAVLVAALWSVAAVRDAGWVVALCSIAAFALTPLVIAPQRRFGGNLAVLFLGWLGGVYETFKWAGRGRGTGDDRKPGTMRGVWTALVTLALLLVFGGLFAAADSAFADLIAKLMPDLSATEIFVRLTVAAVLFPVLLVWVYAAAAKPRFDGEDAEARRRVSRFELAVPLGALNLLFAAFIAVQLRVYVGGEGYVMDTKGLTFAEYARTGFWQLSVVAFLSLAVIAVAAWLAPKREKRDRWTVRLLLGPLGLMSMVVIASALFRMYTYFETYGLTRMRVWVFTVEIWLAVLFALVLVCCWKLRATWLPRAILASGALTLLGLAAVNPDALIARYNIEHDRKLDLYYLQGLSADAVPELMGLPQEDRECALRRGWDAERDFLAWNWGSQRAAELAAEVNVSDYPDCEYQRWYGGSGSESQHGWEAEAEETEAEETEAAETEAEAAGESPPGNGLFTAATCDEYDLEPVTELFGTSAKGDRGLESDGSSQFANAPSVEFTNAWYLQCGYYGPGARYLMVEAYQWLSPVEATEQVELRREEYGTSGNFEEIDDIAVGSAGFSAWSESPRTQFYIVAHDELVIVVRLLESVVGEEAEAVAADLAEQTFELYSAQ